MGVRPPSNDTSEPDVIEFGIAAVDARLEEWEVAFPATRDELIDAIGDRRVPYDAQGSEVRLREALEAVDPDRFEDEQELLDALHPIFEEYRASRGTSVVRQVRSMLPF